MSYGVSDMSESDGVLKREREREALLSKVKELPLFIASFIGGSY